MFYPLDSVRMFLLMSCLIFCLIRRDPKRGGRYKGPSVVMVEAYAEEMAMPTNRISCQVSVNDVGTLQTRDDCEACAAGSVSAAQFRPLVQSNGS